MATAKKKYIARLVVTKKGTKGSLIIDKNHPKKRTRGNGYA